MEEHSGSMVPEEIVLLKRRMKEISEQHHEWYEDATRWVEFASGKQWSDEDETAMLNSDRPALVFNYMIPSLNLICGTEISSRREPRYLPRTVGDQVVSDVLNETVKYFREECHANHEESLAFRDCAVTGVGVTETWMDYSERPEGMVVTERIPIRHIGWDPNAKKQNLSDARYVVRAKWISEEEFSDLFGSENLAQVKGGSVDNPMRDHNTPAGSPHHADLAWLYHYGKKSYDPLRRQVLVLDYQYKGKEEVLSFRQPSPDGSATPMVTVPVEEVMSILQADPVTGEPALPEQTIKTSRTCVWQCFVAGDILLDKQKLKTGGKFTYQFMTAFHDETDDVTSFFGIIKLGEDPQRWTNKFLSQIVSIIGHSPKGSILAEHGALHDPESFQRNWSKPNSMNYTKSGMLEKVKVLDPPNIPSASSWMMQFSKDAIPQIFGVNPYFSGQVDDLKRTPSSSIQAVQQQGMTTMGPLYDGLDRYRKMIGELYLEYLRNYVEEGMMVRIQNPPNAQYVPFSRDMAIQEYDVVVSDNPKSTSNLDALWKSMTEQGFLKMFVDMGIPLPPETVDMIPDMPEQAREPFRRMLMMLQAQMMGGPPGGEPPPEEG